MCTLHTSTIVYFISGRVRILLCREPIQRSWEFYTGGADTDDEPTNFQIFNPILTDRQKHQIWLTFNKLEIFEDALCQCSETSTHKEQKMAH